MKLEVGKLYISKEYKDIIRITSINTEVIEYNFVNINNKERAEAVRNLMKLMRPNASLFLITKDVFIKEFEEFMPETRNSKEDSFKILKDPINKNFEIEVGKIYINNFNGNKVEVIEIKNKEIYYKIIEFNNQEEELKHKMLESTIGSYVCLSLKEKRFRKRYVPFIGKKVEATIEIKPNKELKNMLDSYLFTNKDERVFIIRKRLKDCSIAHRLMNYNGKCENLHGHTYHFEIGLVVKGQKENGISMDFNDFKEIDKFLQDNWDHATIVNIEDKTLKEFLEKEKQRLFVLYGNPTAENMCLFLKEYVKNTFKDNKNIVDIKVKIWETETSICEF